MRRATTPPVRRRLSLLTALAAAGGALFVPFVLANPAVDAPATPILLAVFSLGAGLITALSAWAGLRLADRVGLPMPLLRRWEAPGSTGPVNTRSVLHPIALGGLLGLLGALIANLIGVPDNPGSLLVRVATTPFAAVVPEVLLHLFFMSALVRLTGRVWVGVVVSAVAFVLLFHGNPPEGATAVTLFVVGLNFGLGVLTGWVFARRGFTAAMLAHAAAHAIVLGVN